MIRLNIYWQWRHRQSSCKIRALTGVTTGRFLWCMLNHAREPQCFGVSFAHCYGGGEGKMLLDAGAMEACAVQCVKFRETARTHAWRAWNAAQCTAATWRKPCVAGMGSRPPHCRIIMSSLCTCPPSHLFISVHRSQSRPPRVFLLVFTDSSFFFFFPCIVLEVVVVAYNAFGKFLAMAAGSAFLTRHCYRGGALHRRVCRKAVQWPLC